MVNILLRLPMYVISKSFFRWKLISLFSRNAYLDDAAAMPCKCILSQKTKNNGGL